jgi:hypothetical protein
VTPVDVLILLSFALALFFPINYSRSHWRSTLPGKAMMGFSAIIALVMGLASWRVITGDLPPSWTRATSYVLIATGLAMMDAVLLHEQAKDRQKTKEKENAR